MKKITDFHLPVDLGEFDIRAKEVMYYLYLPIKHPGQIAFALPDKRLEFILPLAEAIRRDEERFINEYLYVTIKKMYVGGGVTANRPGWHCDGFMSTDLNYVWYDCVPTIFTEHDEFRITPDHRVSLDEFYHQAESYSDRWVTYPAKHLLKLDDRVIHKVNTNVPEQIMRTFVKFTLSPMRFNLEGNSRNPLLLDDGPMYERSVVRNDPYQAQRDYYDPKRLSPIDDHQ